MTADLAGELDRLLAGVDALISAVESELAVNVQCGQKTRAQRSRKRLSHLQQSKHHIRIVAEMETSNHLDRKEPADVR